MPSKKRMRYRENKKRRKIEEALERKNSFGYQDLTAYQAVKNIIERDKQNRGEKHENRSD